MSKSLGDINKIYIATEDICKSQHHGLIDTIFENADVSIMTQDQMIVYLDMTWDKKTKFKNRETFYKRCVEELAKRGEKKKTRFEKIL